MIAAGLLVPGGTFHLMPLLSGAILGAVLGDSVSWWLGRHYGHLLGQRWPFGRHPELLARGEMFFRRFGLASVFVGRFFGPLRATIPLLAGIMNMPPLPFWLSNIASAVIWAPALLLPGSAVVLLVDQLSANRFWKMIVGGLLIILMVSAVWLIDRLWFSKTRGKNKELRALSEPLSRDGYVASGRGPLIFANRCTSVVFG